DAANSTVPVQLGIENSIASWPTLVFVLGLLIISMLVARGVRGGILIGIAITTVIAVVAEAIVQVGPSAGTNPAGWALSVPAVPDTIIELPDLSLVGAVSFGAFTHVDLLTVVLLVFTLVLADFFDTIGTVTGLGRQAGFVREDGQLPHVGR